VVRRNLSEEKLNQKTYYDIENRSSSHSHLSQYHVCVCAESGAAV
jgi:hypothetical protein